MISRHRRLATLAAGIGLVALFLPVLAGIAFGHHTVVRWAMSAWRRGVLQCRQGWPARP